MKNQDIAPENIRVLYYQHRPYFVLGPLGCFYVGQKCELASHGEVTVCSIDPDGAAVAWADPSSVPLNFKVSAGCASVDQCAPAGSAAHRRITAGIVAQQERNRREYGVVLPG